MSKHIQILSVILVLFIYSISCISVNETVYSKDNEYRSEEFINVTVYERINPAIVLVEAQLVDGLSSGTGCIINKSGIILTSSHVVDNASYIEVTTSKGETYKAEISLKNGNNTVYLSCNNLCYLLEIFKTYCSF